jgi:hypothetical protein
MVWYYRLDLEEVYNAKTVIPEEMWEKKQVLPYRKTYGEVAGIEIGETEVVETVYKVPEPVKNLEQVKEDKLNSIRSECGREISEEYPDYKQLNILRLADGYTQTNLDTMNTFIDGKRTISNSAELAVNNATTIEEVEAIYFRKDVLDGITIIGTSYWGE